MTAMINYTDSPRYQRMIQKFATLRPEQRAILDTALIDEKFADEAMQKHLKSLITASDLRNKSRALDIREKEIGLSGKQADARYSLLNDAADFERGQNRMGNLIGAANIPISGYFGYKQMQRATDEAESNRLYRKKVQADLDALRAKAGI